MADPRLQKVGITPISQYVSLRRINPDIAAAIRARYSVDDEFKALRTHDPDYAAFVAEQVAAGKEKKTRLGFDNKPEA